MQVRFNRFAIVPTYCGCCKRYVWLEPYRRDDIHHSLFDYTLKENLCKRCVDKYLPKMENIESNFNKLTSDTNHRVKKEDK